MTLKRADIYEVFKEKGQPTVTYVDRDGGALKTQLSRGIDSKGTICLLTGPSKTGKTTLRTEVVKLKKLDVIVVQCEPQFEAVDFWKAALKQVNHEEVKSRSITNDKKFQSSADVGAGFKFLATLTSKLSGGMQTAHSETEQRDKIVPKESPALLLPALKKSQQLLVVENFHYLKADVQEIVFKQMKPFVDDEISIIVIGTTHHAEDLVKANPDLLGHIRHIEIENWSPQDLKQIAQKGFNYLHVDIHEELIEMIANESVGLPIITQQVCRQLLENELGDADELTQSTHLTQNALSTALHGVATTNYGLYAQVYERFVRGPREQARNYNTYDVVLQTFKREPLKFSLTRKEIDERINTLKSISPSPKDFPPPGSVKAMLDAIGPFQERLSKPLLEWRSQDQRLHVLEPGFLFYLRWKDKAHIDQKMSPSQGDFFSEMFQRLRSRST